MIGDHVDGLRGPLPIDPAVQFQTSLRELIQRHLAWTKPPTREAVALALEAEAGAIRATLPRPVNKPGKVRAR